MDCISIYGSGNLFLSVGMIGWNLAVWRLAATLLLSLAAGFITHALVAKDWLGRPLLRSRKAVSVQSMFKLAKDGWVRFRKGFAEAKASKYTVPSSGSNADGQLQLMPIVLPSKYVTAPTGFPLCSTCSPTITVSKNFPMLSEQKPDKTLEEDCPGNEGPDCGCSTSQKTFKSVAQRNNERYMDGQQIYGIGLSFRGFDYFLCS